MEGEKARELKRTAELTSRPPLAGQKRQRSLSSVQQQLNSLNSRSGGSRKSSSGRKQQRHLSEQVMAAEKWGGESKVSKPKGSKTTQASGATCSRKRVKLIEKVSHYYRAVDSAGVPRKLRSAINKRAGESPSPCAVGEKWKQSDTKTSIGMTTDWATKAHILLTKEEEEVVEILVALSANVEDYPHTKGASGGRVASDDTDPPEQACLPGPLEEFLATKHPVPLLGISDSEGQPEEPRKVKSASDVDTSIQKVSTSLQKSHEAGLELNDGTEANEEAPSLFMVDRCDNLKLSDATVSASRADAPSGSLLANAAKQSAQFGVSVCLRSEVESDAVQCTTSSTMGRSNEQNEKRLPFLLPEGILKSSEAEVEMLNSQLTTSNDKILRPFSNKPAADLAFVAPTRRCLGSNRSTEKPLLLSADKGRKRCTTHGYICHLIQYHYNTLKASGASSDDRLNQKGTTALAISESNKLRNGLSGSSVAVLCSPASKNQLDMSSEVPEDRKFQVVLQPHTTPGLLSQRKQTCNFLTLSAGCETINRGSGTELCGKLPIACLHTLPSQHPVAPPSVSRGHYSSQPDYLSASAPHQVHLQVPPQYISQPFYTSHNGYRMKHEFQQQQQQVWQGHHLSHYTAKLPGSKQQQHKVCDSPAVETRGLAVISMQHQRIPLPLLPASHQSS